jgi:hypothetical protein
MKRAEFITLFVAGVDRGRAARFPDMTPAERACAGVYDAAKAFRVWRRLTPGQRAGLSAEDVAPSSTLPVFAGGRDKWRK